MFKPKMALTRCRSNPLILLVEFHGAFLWKSPTSFVQLLEPYRFGQSNTAISDGGESMRNVSYDCAKFEPFSLRAVEPVHS